MMMPKRTLLAALLLAAWVIPATLAEAQIATPAQILEVRDGKRLDSRLTSGVRERVTLIGIDIPAAGECGASDARALLERLAVGRAVSLVSDPRQGPLDEDGRALVYVQRADETDVAEELLARGLARLDADAGGFTRKSTYRDAEADARSEDLGVWSECGGDFHPGAAEQRRIRARSAEAFVRGYYRNISSNRFLTAWRMLSPAAQRAIGGSYRAWKRGHRRSLGTAVRSARVRVAGPRAVVRVSLRSRDRDACNGRTVRQRFRGTLRLAASGDSWEIARLKITKTAGGRVRVSKAQCPRPKRKRRRSGSGGGDEQPSPTNCQGYSPCLPPGPDVDCAGGTGNGPRYTGPVTVMGDDPYDLDRDGDGTGCDS